MAFRHRWHQRSPSSPEDSEVDPRTWFSPPDSLHTGLTPSPRTQVLEELEWCIVHDVDSPVLAAAREEDREAAWEEEQEWLAEERLERAQWLELTLLQNEEEAEYESYHRAQRRQRFYRSQNISDKAVWKHHLEPVRGVIGLR